MFRTTHQKGEILVFSPTHIAGIRINYPNAAAIQPYFKRIFRNIRL